MANVQWIKIYVDMFDNKKIKFIRTLPEGNDILLCWIMLLTTAGKCNSNGFIFLTENIPYTVEMLSNEFNIPLNTIKLAIETFKNLNMIDRDKEVLCVSSWQEYQNIEGMDKIREQSRLRMQKHRENLKMLRNSHATVTSGDAVEEEIEEEIEEDKEIDKEVIPYQDIIDLLNQKAGTKFKATDKHKECIRARWKEGYGLTDFKTVIDKKYKEWAGTEQAKYIRPITLFGTKFDGYLNQVEGGPKNGKYQQSTRKTKATNITKPSTPTRSRKASEWED
ncbi:MULTISPECIES: phage replisome organizer N-terminal domain-containing protein [Pelosinus]|uniref:Replisome organizer region-containing protein n=1 Tax=Pelosinus fermentans B4 TaxID=1149862 RepID=I9B6F8_9FIRM|nr:MULTISPECIES: phage replisome organizer N-terminal domain-containing protein [Pelosinus]EIW20737.1 replisome organizer region-containing protein [Pelosinus fermentans B4]EIW25418.1 replisome organizer region-containing protein [Pelosinus fermentans A11]OAM93676.1 replisome organizer region-containing protein [Pelosinus fermentans DSM 17108]SDQ86225.1 phage replisome organizer, putative, N-terminal region/phage conserved hypothetical protein, C-terminal domain-containing protein [Pelosinus fe